MSGPPLPKQVAQANGVDVGTNVEENAMRMSSTNNLPGQNSNMSLGNSPVDSFRPLKVIVIGAGYSGIYCGIRIPEKLRNVELVIYEKNAGIGGTWWENRYPGCACDIPSHSYQFSFNPNPRWSALYASASEIREYLESSVRKYSVDRFIKLSHKIESCRWDASKGKWIVAITDLINNRRFEDSAEVLINARGGLNEPSWPDIPGLKDFKGELMHSAIWNQSYDFKNKKIGIIGNGSSSIQIVPKLQEISGSQVSVFVRSRTWISPPFSQELWDSIGMNDLEFSQEQRDKFANDAAEFQKFRVNVEEAGNGVHPFTLQNSPMSNGARQYFTSIMKSRLSGKPEIFDELIPSFAPGCRRLTPGPGYLEALTKPNVSFVKTPISGFEAGGVRTEDSSLHEFDVIVCATGFKSFVAPPFPITGVDDLKLSDHWTAYPRTYMSVASDKFPNHFLMLGPNGAIGAGSLTIMLESAGDYIVKCIRKLQKENYKSMAPKSDRVDDFVECTRAYFPMTVYKDNCRSWYKNKNDDVTGLWPGSTLHFVESVRSPRWEDWEYESRVTDRNWNGSRVNQLHWLGNGFTSNQMDGRHMAWYLQPQFWNSNMPVAPLPEESEVLSMRPFSH